MKYITYTLALVMFAASMSAVALPTQVEAACNYNGYYNSDTNCSRSYTYTSSYINSSLQRNANDAQITLLEQQATYLESLLERIYALIEDLKEDDATYNPYPWNNGSSDVDVTTRSANDITDEEATLRSEVDFNNEDEATVYFEYGKSSTNLKYDTTHRVLDENDDDDYFKQKITDLDDDTKYYFRAIAEDENGDEDYGNILSFRTHDNGSYSNDDEPDVDTQGASNITDHSAKIKGGVDMNDFNNGVVFFVYGEDEDQIDDIADDYDTYSDVDEDEDDLQKVKVDSDLDGDASYYASFSGLNDDTDIFYSICVEFEDEDNNDMIICGDTEDFTTNKD